jgi:hypothetical protein
MHPLDVEVLGLLSLMEILNAPVGEFEGIAQVAVGVLPGLFEALGSDLKRFRTEVIELLGEFNQGLITFQPNTAQDGIDRGLRLLLGIPGGATGDPVEFLFCKGDVMETTQQGRRCCLAARRCHRREEGRLC